MSIAVWRIYEICTYSRNPYNDQAIAGRHWRNDPQSTRWGWICAFRLVCAVLRCWVSCSVWLSSASIYCAVVFFNQVGHLCWLGGCRIVPSFSSKESSSNEWSKVSHLRQTSGGPCPSDTKIHCNSPDFLFASQLIGTNSTQINAT